MASEQKVQCGDIIEYPDGHMIVEKIKPDGMLVGHKLSRTPVFAILRNPKIVNSDFRYAHEARADERLRIASMSALERTKLFAEYENVVHSQQTPPRSDEVQK